MGAQPTSRQLTATPVSLRTVEPQLARLIDRFVACPLVPLEGGDWFAWQHVGEPVVVDRLSCWAPCGPFELAVDGLSRLSPGWVAPPAHVPDDIALGLLESACAPVFTALSAYFGEGTRVDAIARGPLAAQRPAAGLAVGFVLGRPQFGFVARGWLHATSDVLRRANFVQPRTAWTPMGLALPLRVSVQLGTVSLTLEALRALRQGDVLRLDEPPAAQGPLPVVLHMGPDHVVLGRAQDRQLVVESSMRTSLQTSDTPPGDRAGTDTSDPRGTALEQLPALGAMPCTLRVELAELRMTVAQVADLRPGRTLPLGTALDERTVSLHVNGHCVGRGELVMLGSELAVLLTQTAPQD